MFAIFVYSLRDVLVEKGEHMLGELGDKESYIKIKGYWKRENRLTDGLVKKQTQTFADKYNSRQYIFWLFELRNIF